jgi:hypothetical protein
VVNIWSRTASVMVSGVYSRIDFLLGQAVRLLSGVAPV